jgi:nucleolar protein 15
MKQYFNQFGRVLRLRLSRNKTTGASKHYAFVEFASGEVADIVARTMDSYLLFGHILKCKLVPADQVRPDLFLGAGQRFKIDPRNKKAGLEMERGVERAQWQKRVEHENKRRAGKSKYLKETLGYEIEAPNLRSVDDVPMQDAGLENGDAQEQLADAPAEEAPAAEAPEDVATLIEEQPKSKKQRKGAAKKTKAEVAIVEPEPAVEPETVVVVKAIVETNTPAPASKAKTNKKRKSDVAVNTEVPTEDVTVVDKLQRKMKKKARTSAPQA